MRYAAFSLLLSAVTVAAQSSAPTFAVASVHPSAGTQIGASFKIEGNRFVADGATLRDLISRAYSVQDFQIVTSEPWMSKDRFDINARTAEAPRESSDLNTMLQGLLAERFGLKVRHEITQGPVYAPTADGPLHPAMQRSSMDCTGVNKGRDLLDGSPVRPGMEGCQPRTQFVAGATGARITLTRPGITMKQFVTMLAPFASGSSWTRPTWRARSIFN